MTRIVAGRAGGRNISVPASGTRPTSERVREALFSRLDTMGLLEATHVWDLFAGSGALGLEAASRGASRVCCVEKARAAANVIARNIAHCDLKQTVVVQQMDVLAFVQRWSGAPVDVVLIDPPYDYPDEELAEVLVALVPHLVADALVVVERSSRSGEPTWPTGTTVREEKENSSMDESKTVSAGLVLEERRAYGDTILWFAGPPSPDMDA